MRLWHSSLLLPHLLACFLKARFSIQLARSQLLQLLSRLKLARRLAHVFQRFERVRQLCGAIGAQFLALEAASSSQKASIVEHVQATWLERPKGACLSHLSVLIDLQLKSKKVFHFASLTHLCLICSTCRRAQF